MADDSFDRLLLDLALQLSATPDLDTGVRVSFTIPTALIEDA